MLNEYNEQIANSSSSLALNLDISEQFELMIPEQLPVTNYLPQESDFESDDYLMELELEFDE